MMRFLTAIALAVSFIATSFSVAMADVTYYFTVNVNVKNLPKTSGGKPIDYQVDCYAIGSTGANGAPRVSITSLLDAQGSYAGSVKLSAPYPQPASTYECKLFAYVNGSPLSDSVAAATIWDPSKSQTVVSGNIPK